MRIGLAAGGIQYTGGTPSVPNLAGTEALILWADAGKTITTGVLSGWNDGSGHSLNFSAAGGARPTAVTSWLNGLDGVTFNGSSHKMTCSSSAWGAGSPYMVLMVVTATSDPDSVDPGSNERAYFGVQSASGNDFRCNTRLDSGASIRRVAWTGGAGPTISGTYGIGTSPAILSWATDAAGGSFVFRANGVAKTTSGPLAATTSSSLTLELGGGSLPHAFTVGDVIVYTEYDLAKLAQAEEFRAYRWNL
jgi:hypothetical protein